MYSNDPLFQGLKPAKTGLTASLLNTEFIPNKLHSKQYTITKPTTQVFTEEKDDYLITTIDDSSTL